MWENARRVKRFVYIPVAQRYVMRVLAHVASKS